MRTSNDICLLCDTNNATKENSHIIPKFIGKSILSESTIKRAYIVDTNRGHLPADFTQDTVKENYLFCPTCELYFSHLETYIAKRLHKRLWTERYAEQFPRFENQGGITWKVCSEVDKTIFRLFVYSIILRCSLSSNKLHAGFNLDSAEEIILKTDLRLYLSNTYKELMGKMRATDNEISILPFVIYTSHSFQNGTKNNIYTSSHNKNPYVLHLNDYVILFSFTSSTMLDRFDFLVNSDNSAIKIGFFNEQFWDSLRQQFMTETAHMTVRQTIEAGNTPYVAGNL